MLKYLFTSFFVLTVLLQAQARIIRSVQSGNWGAASTWDLGAPAPGDTIFIESIHTITVNVTIDYYGGNDALPLMLLQVEGTLAFNNGRKLRFPANSGVIVPTDGLVDGTGSGASNVIESGGTTIWRTDQGDLIGPRAVGNTPTFPLPIHVIFFDAIDSEEGIMVFWKANLDASVCSFELYRSDNLQDWEKIDTQFVAETNTIGNFQFLDNRENTSEDNYYYLKEVACDGSAFFSRVVNVRHRIEDKIRFYPNPASNHINVIHSSDDVLNVEIVDQSGVIVIKDQTLSNFHEVSTSVLNPGLYIVRIGNSTQMKTLPLIIK